MRSKIITYLIISLFLLSIIGIPVSLHYCELMKQKSIFSCEICEVEKAKVISSCCETEQNNYSETIVTFNLKCCHDELLYKKIVDEFLYTKTEFNSFPLLERVLYIADAFHVVNPIQAPQTLFSDVPPPFLIDPNIYITNLTLLI